MVEREVRNRIFRIRKGRESHPQLIYRYSDIPPLEMSDNVLALWDPFIHRWYSLLRNASNSIEHALRIRKNMMPCDWNINNSDYVAMCKWIESGIDGIRQWDFESDNIVENILSGLEWKSVSEFRNLLAHSFVDSHPQSVTKASDEWLPELLALLKNSAFCSVTTSKEFGFRIPRLKIEAMKRLGTLPLDAQGRKDEIEAGAKIPHQCARLYFHYDPLYYHYIFYMGYDYFGRHWMVAPRWETVPRTMDIEPLPNTWPSR